MFDITAIPARSRRTPLLSRKCTLLLTAGLMPMVALLLACLLMQQVSKAQTSKDKGEFSRYAGGSPSHAKPYATDVSPALTRKAVSEALRKVGDWQLQKSQSHYDQDWTFAVLYAGFMAVPDEAGGQRYRESMKTMGAGFHWQPGPDIMDANDDAVGQTYLALYLLDHDPQSLLPTKQAMDRLIASSDLSSPTGKPLWWWCDGLFMAPPVLAMLSKITENSKYIDFMDRQWSITSDRLYDRDQHLFFRDARFLDRHEANGKSLFWARGNGWVVGGLVRVLEAMPKDYPSRSKYVAQFQQMSSELITLQRPDGLWTVGLLDPAGHPMAETSGSSLITYGLAYGIREGLLDRSVFEPHVRRAWAGIVSHIYSDGRLGAVQPVADSPGMFKPASTYVYGVGAFLLAGSEIYQLADD